MPRPPHWALRCLSFLVIALLLAPLASSTGMEPHCKDEEMSCFFNTKCVYPTSTKETLTDLSEDKDGCDVHVGIRPYNAHKALIRLRSKSDSIKLVYDDNSMILGCEVFKNGKNEKNVRFLPTESKTKLLYSDTSSGVACEFYWATESTDLFDVSKVVNVVYGKAPNEQTVSGKSKNLLMTTASSAQKCDIDWMTHKFDHDANWTYIKPDKRFNELNCDKGQELVYESDDEEGGLKIVKVAEGIKCVEVEGAPNTYNYEITKKKAVKEGYVIDKDNSRKVACRAQVCKQCAEVPSCNDPTCPKVVPSDDKDGCKVLKCLDAKAKYLKVNNAFAFTPPTCQAHEIDKADEDNDDDDEEEEEKTEFKWMDGDKEVTKVECVSTVHCQVMNPLAKLSEEAKKAGLDLSKKILKCGDGYLMKINGKPIATEITCNDETGEWSTNNNDPVAKSSEITCEVVPTPKKDATSGASMGSLEYVALGAGGLIIIAVICVIIFCVITQHRKKAAKRNAAKKIQTIKETDSKQDSNLKTAVPYYPVLPTATTSDPPKKAEPELVEKTMIAQTPTETKQKSLTMKTAVLAPVSERDNGPQQIGEDTLRLIEEENANRRKKNEKKKKGAPGKDEKEASDGSEPKPIKIGKDGAIIEGDQSNAGDRSGDKSGQSEMGTTKKEEKEKVLKMPEDTGPKPQVFPLNEKEEKIRKGAVRKPADYPTLADIKSDWDSNKEREKEKKAEEDRKKRRSSNSRDKTVPTAITPENPDAKASVERTQNTKDKTRNTVEKGEDADILNLLTQMDTTFEQKEADAKKKK